MSKTDLFGFPLKENDDENVEEEEEEKSSLDLLVTYSLSQN